MNPFSFASCFTISINSLTLLSDFVNSYSSSGTVYYLLTLGSFLMDLARNPKRRELRDSCSFITAGDTLMIRLVIEFPPKLYCKRRVSFESR